MVRIWKILFAISGAFVLAGCIEAPVLLPYPLFVGAYLGGWRLPLKGMPGVRLLLSTLVCTMLLEFGAWLGSYLNNETEPALFHPQLIPDLLSALGVYAAWWLTWWLALRRYRFTAPQVFVTTGLYGVLIEQQGQVFIAGLQAFPLGILMWLFVALAYGSTMALAFFLVRDSFSAERDHWLKYPLAWAGLFVLTMVTSLVWGFVLQFLDIMPPKKFPMQDYPLW